MRPGSKSIQAFEAEAFRAVQSAAASVPPTRPQSNKKRVPSRSAVGRSSGTRKIKITHPRSEVVNIAAEIFAYAFTPNVRGERRG